MLNEQFTSDVLSYLTINFLDTASIARLGRVNKQFNTFFNTDNFWKLLLQHDFGISIATLKDLEQVVDIEKTPTAKQLYIRLHTLKNNYPNLPAFLKPFYRDKDQRSLLLKACLEDASYGFKNTPSEHHFCLMILSIYAGGFAIPLQYIKQCQDNEKLKEILNYVALAGNFTLVKYLLDPENNFEFALNQRTLNNAALSGNLFLVEYLLDPKNNFNLLKPDNSILVSATISRNVQLVKYLLDSKNKFGLKLNQYIFNLAAHSGNLQLVQYFLAPKNNFGLKPDQITLSEAANSGNLQLVQYLLDPKNNFGLKPDQRTLHNSASSGNLQLVQYLIDPENNFGLTPDHEALDNAATSGNLQLVQYLLDPKNNFDLTPNQNTLDKALFSGNLKLLQYLLDPQQNFGLNLDKNIFSNAAKYNEFTSGNLHLFKYLFDPKNNFNLILNQTTLDRAAHFGNLPYVQYLLNPKNNFNLKPNAFTVNSAKLSRNHDLIEQVLPCYNSVQSALINFENGNLDEANEKLLTAHQLCPNYCQELVNSFADPQTVKNNLPAIQHLIEAHKKIINDRMEIESLQSWAEVNF